MSNITEAKVNEWCTSTSKLISEATSTFESRFGFPSGENYIHRADENSEELANQLMREIVAAQDLAVFYSVVEEVVLPDIGVGWFIDSAQSVMDEIGSEIRPKRITGGVDDLVTAFGSNGGGDLFALCISGKPVYQLSGGSLIGSTYDMDASAPNPFSDDLWSFLEFIRTQVRDATRSP